MRDRHRKREIEKTRENKKLDFNFTTREQWIVYI